MTTDATPGQNGGAVASSPGAPTAETPVATPPREAFGLLESVQLRRYWKDEARDFTPWLAKEKNLTMLGEVIGMNLELVETEKHIGPFRADILARDEDVEVIIENQLDATDHKHLGQLLVYAANRGSGVIVWVARSVTDEYRKVIDWLNEKTDVDFFALEVELWRIGDSPVAPKFNVVCEPNNFTRAVKATGELGTAQQLQLEFWTGFTQFTSNADTSFTIPKAGGQHWFELRIGTSRAFVSLTALRNGRMGCELYIGHSQADAIYAALETEKDVIEAELGAPGSIEWMPLPERKSCRIAIYQEVASLDSRDHWQQAFEWLLSWAEKFKSSFAARVKALELPDPAAAPAESGPQPAVTLEAPVSPPRGD